MMLLLLCASLVRWRRSPPKYARAAAVAVRLQRVRIRRVSEHLQHVRLQARLWHCPRWRSSAPLLLSDPHTTLILHYSIPTLTFFEVGREAHPSRTARRGSCVTTVCSIRPAISPSRVAQSGSRSLCTISRETRSTPSLAARYPHSTSHEKT